MSTVYVVFTWKDYRKKNKAKILGVYRNQNTAIQNFQQFAEEFANDSGGDIEKGENYYNIINGQDYQVFEIKMMPLIE